MSEFIRGTRPQDRVEWTARINQGVDYVDTMSGSRIPVQIKPSTIELTLHCITENEALLALDMINKYRGGDPRAMLGPAVVTAGPDFPEMYGIADGIKKNERWAYDAAMAMMKRSPEPKPKQNAEPEPPRNRFEGLDL